MKIILGGLRGLQILFGAVVLGLSISLAKGQAKSPIRYDDGKDYKVPGLPARTGYICFIGAFTILAGLVGATAVLIEKLEGVITWGLDILTSLGLLAGGIMVAVGLKGTDCGNVFTLFGNDLLNCGVRVLNDQTYVGGCTATAFRKDQDPWKNRCRMYKADDVFVFFALLVTVAALAMSFRSKKRSANYV